MGKKIGIFLVVFCTIIIFWILGYEGKVREEEVQEEVVLKTASMFGGTTPSAKVYQHINEQFMEEHQNVVIEDESENCDEEWKMEVAANFATGNEPDIIQFFTDAVAESFLETDKLVSLEEIKREYPEYAKDVDERVLESVKNRDGVARAVPTTGYWSGLFCNKELFQKYDLDIPTDWDSLVKAIREFREQGVTPIDVSLNYIPHYWIEHLLLYTVGEKDYASMPPNDPQMWIKAFETLKELKKMGAFSESDNMYVDKSSTQLFRQGKAAMQLEGSWYASSLLDTKLANKITVVPFPGVRDQKAKKGAVIGGVFSGFYITRRAWNNTKKRELAVRFVEAHTKRESLIKYWGGNGISTFKGKVEMELKPLTKEGKKMVESASSLNKPIDSRVFPETYKTIIDGTVDVTEGKKDIKTLLDEAFMMNGSSE